MDGGLAVIVMAALVLAIIAGLAWQGIRRRRASRVLTREERLRQVRNLSRKTGEYSKKNVRRTKPADVGDGGGPNAADGSGTPF